MNEELKYFEELANNKELLKQGYKLFFWCNIIPGYHQINENQQTVSWTDSLEGDVTLSFLEMANEVLDEEQRKAQASIFAKVKTFESSPDNYIQKIKEEIGYIMLTFRKNCSDERLHHIFDNAMLGLSQSVDARYNANNILYSNGMIDLNDLTYSPIKWNAGVGSLCMLFYDLMYKFKIKGETMIDFLAPESIIEFIHVNFRDEKGENFNKNSITTYFTNSTKTAVKYRIRIPDAETVTSK